ncbi:MAG TPA: hypothetical protein VLT83_09625, partial [Opitutaceae bacterium]|nr:hypothetical protein [Opitutaceae bacterium]
RRQLWNGGHRRWCYVLDAEQLGDLRARYGAGGEDAAEDAAGAPAPRPAVPGPAYAGEVVRAHADGGASPLGGSDDAARCRSDEDARG